MVKDTDQKSDFGLNTNNLNIGGAMKEKDEEKGKFKKNFADVLYDSVPVKTQPPELKVENTWNGYCVNLWSKRSTLILSIAFFSLSLIVLTIMIAVFIPHFVENSLLKTQRNHSEVMHRDCSMGYQNLQRTVDNMKFDLQRCDGSMKNAYMELEQFKLKSSDEKLYLENEIAKLRGEKSAFEQDLKMKDMELDRLQKVHRSKVQDLQEQKASFWSPLFSSGFHTKPAALLIFFVSAFVFKLSN